jgi:DNA polymerase III alpha subunit
LSTSSNRLTDPRRAEEAGAAFLALCEKAGVARPAAEVVLGQLLKFQGYSFCKAHAVSTAVVAWQECHLKAHHPLAFWTAVLNNHQGAYPRRVHAEAAKRAGLALYLPCVNRSSLTYTQEVSGVRTGLGEKNSRGVAPQIPLPPRRRGLAATVADELVSTKGRLPQSPPSGSELLRKPSPRRSAP